MQGKMTREHQSIMRMGYLKEEGSSWENYMEKVYEGGRKGG